MREPLADDGAGQVITAARLLAAGALWARLVLLPWPRPGGTQYVCVQIGDYVPSLDLPYLSAFRVMCEMVDVVREMRGVRVVA